jgi:hypothetical protein
METVVTGQPSQSRAFDNIRAAFFKVPPMSLLRPSPSASPGWSAGVSVGTPEWNADDDFGASVGVECLVSP